MKLIVDFTIPFRNRVINITALSVRSYTNSNYGELKAYFDTESWDYSSDGYIYGEQEFLDALCEHMSAMNLDVGSVDYSEAGMQGSNYVSMDVDSLFIESFVKNQDKII